jgi:DNA-binding NtrC family response regulator
MNKVLVVDDDPELRSKLSILLKDAGYDVDEATSGPDALVKVRSVHFDIVLIDFLMPQMNGMETLIELKRIRPKTKVIMITAYAQLDKAVEATKKGASDYISKPFKVEQLNAKMKLVLEEARFEEGIRELDLDHTLSALSQSTRRKIVRLLMSLRSMHYTEIARELDLKDFSKAAFHLKTLKEAGIVEQDEDKLYSLTKEGKKIVEGLNFLENYLSDNVK